MPSKFLQSFGLTLLPPEPKSGPEDEWAQSTLPAFRHAAANDTAFVSDAIEFAAATDSGLVVPKLLGPRTHNARPGAEARGTDLKAINPGIASARYTIGRKIVYAVLALAAVGVACAAITVWVAPNDIGNELSTAADKPIEGLTILAVFFVAALGIERLLEPISRAVVAPVKAAKEAGAKAAEQEWIGELDAALVAKERWASAVHTVTRTRADNASGAQFINAVTTAESKANEAAKKVDDAADKANDKANPAAEAAAIKEAAGFGGAVLLWTLATAISMFAAAKLHLYFLHTVGISSGTAWIEILATGLIIGAGTKPLHDLVELISSKKDAAAQATKTG